MAFWWVNHKQTRDHEVRGGYLWSPMRNANGAFNQTYENMRHARIGDVVFSYAHGQIGAIGIVTVEATPSPKPTVFGNAGDYWSDEGWLVEAEFTPVARPLAPKAHMTTIGPMLPPRYSPLQRNGNGNQGCYLAALSDALGQILVALLDADEIRDLDAPPGYRQPEEPHPYVLEDIHRIEADTSIPETERRQLAKARMGQGLFRKRVILLDRVCRVTGVTDTRLLIASHIKPWQEASNAERINGFNGVLLSPHVDALFDAHLMTFESNGRMHVHESVSRDVLERWSIDPDRWVEPFRPEQESFLKHHQQRFAGKVAGSR